MKLRPAKKTNARRSRGKGTSLLNILTGKWGKNHRLPAHVTGEGDWEVEVPQIRMSRAFAVMLVLHIVAVGGLFAFRIWGRDDDKKDDVQVAENTAPATDIPAESPSLPAAPAPEPVPATAPAAAQVHEDVTPAPVADTTPQRTYAWRTGDTLPLVAARFGVSGQALREANPDKLLVPGTVLVVPKAGRVIDSMDVASAGGKPSDFFDPSVPVIASPGVVDAVPPKAEVVPELELDSVVADAGVPSGAVDTGNLPGEARPENVAAVRPEAAAPAAVLTKPPVRPAAKPADSAAVKPKVKTPEAAQTPSRTAGQRAHVVSKGDTVYNIARRYGVSADEIAKLNGLGGDYRIRMGQQLRIPVRR